MGLLKLPHGIREAIFFYALRPERYQAPLDPERRDKIMLDLLHSPVDSRRADFLPRHTSLGSSAGAGLLLVNRQTRIEALAIFYSRVIFYYEMRISDIPEMITHDRKPREQPLWGMHMLPPGHRSHICHLHIHVGHHMSDATILEDLRRRAGKIIEFLTALQDVTLTFTSIVRWLPGVRHWSEMDKIDWSPICETITATLEKAGKNVRRLEDLGRNCPHII